MRIRQTSSPNGIENKIVRKKINNVEIIPLRSCFAICAADNFLTLFLEPLVCDCLSGAGVTFVNLLVSMVGTAPPSMYVLSSKLRQRLLLKPHSLAIFSNVPSYNISNNVVCTLLRSVVFPFLKPMAYCSAESESSRIRNSSDLADI